MVLAAGLLYLAWLLRAAMVPFVLAAVLAFMLEPPVRFLEARGLSRLSSILLVYAVVTALAGGALVYLVPVLYRQLTLLAASLPSLTRQVQTLLAEAQLLYSQAGLPAEVRQILEGALVRFEAQLLSGIEAVLSGLFDAVSGLLVLVLAPFLAFYLLRDRDAIRESVLSVIPVSAQGEGQRVLSEMNRVLAGFIRGQVLVALIVGTLVGVATELLGLRFSAVLGVIAGLTNIIPYFGPVIGALPAVLLALLESPLLALKTAGAFFIIQQVDSLFITPRVVGGQVGLHPLVVIFSLLAGGQLFGFVGILAAVPVVAVSRVFVRYLFHKLVTDWSR